MAFEVEIDLYEYFGISFESSAKEIKKAYKIKAKELHPDKNKGDPQAKEKFQKLKEYHDILLDPARKVRHMEKEAAARREEANRMAEKNRIAERIRKDWEASREAAACAARREHLDTVKAASRTSDGHVIVSVKWKNKHGSLLYNREFLYTCLREFGTVLNVIVGKKCSAVAEFASRLEAENAIKAASVGLVGHMENPLKVSWPLGPAPHDESGADPAPASTKHPRPPSPTTYQPSDNISFETFESDVLEKMARFG
ncbi:dnaJ subfamily C 7 [Echinococcus multilocularis]|uniref:DnaJ subfamily C 7 n=1 Tax=Echinococcus multilocularis TaxID=6211 RepID=A0A087W104_ECHMU|nr:dnaJ subfamily C 7 [Echinococcus multilocularis]